MSSSGFKYISVPSAFAFLITLVWGATPELLPESSDHKAFKLVKVLPPDSLKDDTSNKSNLPYPIKDRKPYEREQSNNPLDLGEPSNVKNKYELDPESNSYNYSSTVGGQEYRLPASVSVKDQLKEENKRQNDAYFRQRAQANNFVSGSGVIPPLKVGPKIFEQIFGSGIIDIRPRGTAELIFQGNFNTIRNPAYPPQQQTTGQFDFRQKIQLNVQGNVGDKLKVNINYDTEATFDFENQIKLDYSGKEDDIIKKIELGNVSLPLNSTLIQGSQSLFGVKTTMQFGKMTVTSIFTQQRGKTTETEITGGSQTTKFDLQVDNYDMNRHYFLSQYFRDNYDAWLANLPIVGSPVQINRIEVWVINRTGSFDGSRDVMGFEDLGESDKRDNKSLSVDPNKRGFPDNNTNSLYAYLTGKTSINKDTAALRASRTIKEQLLNDQSQTNLEPISQYQMISYARLLTANDYTINTRLGYISLNQVLNNDDVLCVAYNYTIAGIAETFKVGEFTTDVPANQQSPNVLMTKMLKGPSLRPDLPIWDLMMKNVYSLGTYGIQQKDFKFNIIYADDPSGADLNYIPAQGEPLLTGKPLIQVLNLDNLNTQQERAPDGLFDFIEGVTINSQQGRIFFPSVEPFGKYLASKFNDPNKARYYCYFELYDSTRFAAIQLPQYDKFFMRGSYQGQSSSEVSLNATNIPRGSVKVTANGALLTENVDYSVDYNLGRVKILNTGLLNSGAVIKVSSESNSLFSVQQKSLMGSRFDYKVSNDFLLGGTVLYLNERPLTPKVNIGEEPISNVMIGLDGSYRTESRFLTKLIDKLPFLETKEQSQITLTGEYARLFPGVQSALAQNGTSYLDDFEGSETQIDLRLGNNWVLASTPQGQPDMFPEGNTFNDLTYSSRRANLAWYTIATTFFRDDSYTPSHIKSDQDMLSDNRMREVTVDELYPKRQIQQGLPNNQPTLDLAFYPKERGSYNYTVTGLNADGSMKNPKNNWSGIMRAVPNNDFEAANIDYIEIWIMDPYLSNPNPNNKGQLYINLGNISEDVLRDAQRAAENGLPKSDDPNDQYVDTTAWGRVPSNNVVNFAFDADPNIRLRQDVGLDGVNDDGERSLFDSSYIRKLSTTFPNSTALSNAQADPSNDNYHYYLGSDYDGQKLNILQRYKKYNRHQGNSPTLDQSPEKNYPTSATNTPDNEDLNKDYTLNDIEEYYQYRIDISKEALVVGQNYVTDTVRTSKKLQNGKFEEVTWYQLKVPIREYEKKIGQILDFKSIRFMRMYMTGFENEQVLRFGVFQLVRADWRKYLNNLEQGKENKPSDAPDGTKFVVSTVNIEKNPNYAVPPGIQREVDFSSPQAIQQNEQALSLEVCNLRDGDARAVFKNTQVDLRQYGRLRMFLHAGSDNNTLKDDELTAFIRLGTDLTNNYYEYEIPLKVTKNSINPNDVWPAANEMNILLDELINTKIERTNANYPFTAVYVRKSGNIKYSVIGLPDLSNVRVIMLGVRNPKVVPGSGESDDGLPKCGEVWFNELRMTDFNNRGGWAANGRVQAKLADFGTMQLAGSVSTVGFGGIDKKIQERNMDDHYQYVVQSNFEMGKFFPVKTGISIPLFMSYGNTIVRPFYDPLNPDTKLQKEIDMTTDEARKQRIKAAADDFTAIRSINFTNVRKNRVNTNRNNVYDIENFSFTYSFSETYRRNQTISYYILKNYQTKLMYNYTFKSKTWEPFKNSIKSKHLTLIKDFNLNYLPQSWGAWAQLDRRYGVTINRNNDNSLTIVDPLYDKLYTMTRYYELQYNLSKGLVFSYNANALARIDEPLGRIDETTPQKKDTVWDNLLKGGRITQFQQNVRMNYNIPINKISLLNWVSQSSYTYQVTYQWQQAPPAADSLGNTISNARTKGLNFNFNFIMLYNKIPFLKSINNPGEKKNTANRGAKQDPKAAAKAKKEEEAASKASPFLTYTLKVLMSLKNVTFAHTVTEGTTLPGFKPKPQYFGQNFDNGGPGFDFILGSQDPNYRYKAAANGWLSNDPRITNQYAQNYSENITGKATLEPITDFRIEFNITKTRTLTESVVFRYDTITGGFKDVNQPSEMGTYSISFNAWRTSFKSGSEVFHEFETNRILIAQRQAQNKDKPGGAANDSTGFPEGYGPSSQDVLIPAFLAAYGGTSVNKVGLNAFPPIPDANWKITYSGLSKIEWVKEYLSNVTLTNQYSSTYTVASFQNILLDSTYSGGKNVFTGDYASQYQIRQISIVERWGPFLGIDMTFVNNISTRLQYNRDRTLNFNTTNSQLTEVGGNEFTIGAGYRTTKLALPFKVGGRRKVLENDVNFRLDFSIKNNVTRIRYLDRVSTDAVQGQTVYTVAPTIDYNITQQLMLRIFYNYRRTNPATSNNFPTIIQSGGFSLRYTIQ